MSAHFSQPWSPALHSACHSESHHTAYLTYITRDLEALESVSSVLPKSGYRRGNGPLNPQLRVQRTALHCSCELAWRHRLAGCALCLGPGPSSQAAFSGMLALPAEKPTEAPNGLSSLIHAISTCLPGSFPATLTPLAAQLTALLLPRNLPAFLPLLHFPSMHFPLRGTDIHSSVQTNIEDRKN